MAFGIGDMFHYSAQPSFLPGTRLDHPADIEHALVSGGLDWQVSMRPLTLLGEESSRVPHRVAVVREDRDPGNPGRVVGVVHPGFRPLQNREGAMMFDALFGQGKQVYHTGGYLKQGEVVWLLARLPNDLRIRGEDVLETYLLFTNSHDGSVAIDIRLTTIRVWCQNTLSLALNTKGRANTIFRRGHNGSYGLVKEEAKGFFEFSVKQSEEAERLFTRLAEKPCSDPDFERFLLNLLPDPRAPATATNNPSVKRSHETRLETIARMRQAILQVHRKGIPEQKIDPADRNWWGALNSVTAWSDHIQETDNDRYAHKMLGSGDRLKTVALRDILAFTQS